MQSSICQNAELERLLSKGDRLYRQGELRTALTLFLRALGLARATNNLIKQVNALNRIGLIHCSLGTYTWALNCLDRTLQLTRDLGNSPQLAIIFNKLGKAYLKSQHYSQALRYYSRALDIYQTTGDLVGIVKTSNYIGDIYNNLGLYVKAKDCCITALKILNTMKNITEKNQLHNRIYEGDALHSIGESYYYLGEYQKALNYLDRALAVRNAVWEESVQRLRKNVNPIELTYCIPYAKKADTREDLESIKAREFSQGRELLQKKVEKYSIDVAKTLEAIATVYLSLGQPLQSFDCYELALEIKETLRDRNSDRPKIGSSTVDCTQSI